MTGICETHPGRHPFAEGCVQWDGSEETRVRDRCAALEQMIGRLTEEHPDPAIAAEVRQEKADRDAFDAEHGIAPGWHKGDRCRWCGLAPAEETRLREELANSGAAGKELAQLLIEANERVAAATARATAAERERDEQRDMKLLTMEALTAAESALADERGRTKEWEGMFARAEAAYVTVAKQRDDATAALAEARGALREARVFVVGCGQESWSTNDGEIKRVRNLIDNAAARASAGEQETPAAKPIRWGRHDRTQVYHRWLPAPIGIGGTACGAEGEGMFPGDPPIGAKICNECLANELAAKAAAPQPAGEPASSGREVDRCAHGFKRSLIDKCPADTPPPGEQGEGGGEGLEAELVRRMTAAMREADRAFENSGGSTRHHVRDCLLPILEKHGLRLVPLAPAQPAEHPASGGETAAPECPECGTKGVTRNPDGSWPEHGRSGSIFACALGHRNRAPTPAPGAGEQEGK